ncbi:hypothetical protein [Candidatus Anaplasma sp. TIGMIC]|uniref:hypothetical protein n=1 Tax=Candidatus Anaplasma sp. TIGMIC TaxID=3020713 RepID=UPI00232A8197|nr:hypothetical protein [Candidatus Anaplasma sp. TIGMIC]
MFGGILEKVTGGLASLADLAGFSNRTFTRCDGVNSDTNTTVICSQRNKVSTFYDTRYNTSCAIREDEGEHDNQSVSNIEGGGIEETEEDSPPISIVSTVLNGAQRCVEDVKAMISGPPSSNLTIEGCPMSSKACNRIL